MKFTVVWSGKALEALARLWLESPVERTSITNATAMIDQLLAIDPHDKGESRDDGRRILFVAPLVTIFRVNEFDRMVRILHVRQLKRRGSD